MEGTHQPPENYEPPAIRVEGDLGHRTGALGSGPDFDGTFIFTASGEPL
ncbi:MAG: hypothetical protein ACRDZX_18760 [Acidimicrobiales bacterium]